MTRSPTGIIPQEYNTPRHLPDVIAFLQSMPCSAQEKQELLFGWARNVGLRLTNRDYNQLRYKGAGV